MPAAGQWYELRGADGEALAARPALAGLAPAAKLWRVETTGRAGELMFRNVADRSAISEQAVQLYPLSDGQVALRLDSTGQYAVLAADHSLAWQYCSGGIQAEKCVILDLTDETHGNAQGIGLAEVTTRRLFNKMKLEMTYPTGVTNTFLHLMKIPMIMDNDREALQLALMCCPEAEDHDHMKMIRIPNTAHIGVIEISEGMLPLVENNPNFEVLTEPYDLPFDENGNLF